MKNSLNNNFEVENRIGRFSLLDEFSYRIPNNPKNISTKKLTSRTFQARFLKLKKSKIPKQKSKLPSAIVTCNFKGVKGYDYLLN